jgi:Prohead core protein protease.
MITTTTKKEFPIFYIVEAAVNPSDIRTNIIRENVIETATGSKVKTVTAESVLQSFERLNWNGRTYPAKVVMRGLNENPKIQNDISKKQWAGEWCHPDSKDPVRQSQILDPYVSHFIDKYWQDGHLLKAHVTTAPYGYGFDMYNKLMAGRPWGFSLRAFGATDSNNVALHPLTVITYDQVNRPSHKEAYGTRDDVTSKNEYTDDFLQECSISYPVDTTKLEHQITNFILEKSDNVKIAKELFGLEESCGTFNEKGQVILEGSYLGTSITVFVPIESYIRENYRHMIRGLRENN